MACQALGKENINYWSHTDSLAGWVADGWVKGRDGWLDGWGDVVLLIDPLVGWLADWILKGRDGWLDGWGDLVLLIDLLVGWIADWILKGWDGWLDGWGVIWIAGWMSYIKHLLNSWLSLWFTGRLSNQTSDLLPDWLNCWQTDWLTDWLADYWLNGCLTYLILSSFAYDYCVESIHEREDLKKDIIKISIITRA